MPSDRRDHDDELSVLIERSRAGCDQSGAALLERMMDILGPMLKASCRDDEQLVADAAAHCFERVMAERSQSWTDREASSWLGRVAERFVITQQRRFAQRRGHVLDSRSEPDDPVSRLEARLRGLSGESVERLISLAARELVFGVAGTPDDLLDENPFPIAALEKRLRELPSGVVQRLISPATRKAVEGRTRLLPAASAKLPGEGVPMPDPDSRNPYAYLMGLVPFGKLDSNLDKPDSKEDHSPVVDGLKRWRNSEFVSGWTIRDWTHTVSHGGSQIQRHVARIVKERGRIGDFHIQQLWHPRDDGPGLGMLMRLLALLKGIRSPETDEPEAGARRGDVLDLFHFDAPDNHEMLAISWLFAQITQADCFTLHGFDRRLGAPTILGTCRGIWYPELIAGSSWKQGLVRRFLFDASDAPGFAEPGQPDAGRSRHALPPRLVFPVTDAVESPFAKRERIESCWAARFDTPHLRAVLFLNWRAAGSPTAPTPACKQPAMVCPKPGNEKAEQYLERLCDIDELKELFRFCPEERKELARDPEYPVLPGDLEDALRIANGWLAERRIQVCGPKITRPKDTVLRLARGASMTFASELPLMRRVEEAPEHVEKVPAIDATPLLRVLAGDMFEDEDPMATSVYSAHHVGDEKDEKYKLHLTGGPITDWKNEELKDLEIPLDFDECFVREGGGLASQCIVSRAPVLIRHLNEEKEPKGESLLKLRVRHPESVDSGAEIAVPVFAGEKPIGSISIEREDQGSITPAHLRWLEVLALMTGSLHEFCSKAPKADRAFLGDLLYGDGLPGSMRLLEKAYTDWALKTAEADICYVLLYDDDLGILVPSSISVSPRVVEAVYKKHAPQTAEVLKKKDKKSEDFLKALTNVAPAVVAERIRPEARGDSWGVFRGWTDEAIYPGPNGARREFMGIGSIDEQIHASAFPFMCREGAAPDGVVWIGYFSKDKQLDTGIEKRVQAMTRVIASVYAAHRSWSAESDEPETRPNQTGTRNTNAEEASGPDPESQKPVTMPRAAPSETQAAPKRSAHKPT